ncbi:MAG: hypothetical protein CVU56_06495 [Deltaproteobacteria bacterium HGW-Deltaproteobacteria-14]|jgi:HEAT repeat protein|nr:MAG: hypothetical protein CVU56_06495 [Deltaproteobacteria bacterium HGW-Deltaproteobacteria-14]
MVDSGADTQRDVDTALRRVVAAASAWAGAADRDDDPAALLDREAHVVATLEPSAVGLFFGLVGASGSHGRDAGSAYVGVRSSIIEAGAIVVTEALAGRLDDVSSLEHFWNDCASGHGAPAWLGAVGLAMTGALPLSLDSLEAVHRVSDPTRAALVGFCIGRSARRGDVGARDLVRDAVAAVQDADLVLGIIKGLGDGVWDAGLAWLGETAARAIFDAAEWSHACRGATLVAVASTPDAAIPTLISGLAGCAAHDDARDFLQTALAAAPPESRGALRQVLGARWSRWQPAARAALIVADAGVSELPPDHCVGERSGVVTRAVLRGLEEGSLVVDHAAERRLLRSWADHPDADVRRAVARRLLVSGQIEPQPAGHDDIGELVALPPAALVRNALDQLRAALWTGESDGLVDLARSVPGEERLAAREALFHALDVPNAALRRACVEAIGHIGAATDGPRLMAVARSYRALEGMVAAALRRLNARAQSAALAELYRRRLKWADDDAVDDYCALAGSERVMHLLEALETRFYPGARAGAARAISRTGAHEVVFALRNRGLSDPQEASRVAALQALQELTGSSPSADEVAGYALLFRPTDELTEAVDRARQAGKAALPGLRRTLAKGSWKRRRAACDVLAMIPGREAESTLVETLLDADEDVRMTAMESLLERGWGPTTPHERTLVAVAARHPAKLLEDPAGVDLPTLEQALRLGGYAFRSELLAVMDRLPGWVPAAGCRATIAAIRLQGERAARLDGGVEALLWALEHTWQANPHRARIARGLRGVDGAELAHELTSGGWDWRAREALCQALGRAGDDTGVEALGTCILDDDDDVRKAALGALATIGTEAAAAQVARGFSSPFQEYRELIALALAAVGDAAWPVLGALAADPWWEGRQGAAMTLRGWRGDLQRAADMLVVLATDGEYRVSQPAREGLDAHGLMPRRPAIREAVEHGQVMTIEGIEHWVGAGSGADPDPEIADWLDTMVETIAPDSLPQRLGLIPLFRAEHLAIWLEEAALGRSTRHVGIRLAAADALRALVRRHCTVCHGEGAARCPECGGAGDRPCLRCGGQTIVLAPCPEPDCTARQTMRRIDSRRCQTCRGKGEVAVPCDCAAAGGRVPCELCSGTGRIGCVACEGSGAAPRPVVEPS